MILAKILLLLDMASKTMHLPYDHYLGMNEKSNIALQPLSKEEVLIYESYKSFFSYNSLHSLILRILNNETAFLIINKVIKPHKYAQKKYIKIGLQNKQNKCFKMGYLSTH